MIWCKLDQPEITHLLVQYDGLVQYAAGTIVSMRGSILCPPVEVVPVTDRLAAVIKPHSTPLLLLLLRKPWHWRRWLRAPRLVSPLLILLLLLGQAGLQVLHALHQLLLILLLMLILLFILLPLCWVRLLWYWHCLCK